MHISDVIYKNVICLQNYFSFWMLIQYASFKTVKIPVKSSESTKCNSIHSVGLHIFLSFGKLFWLFIPILYFEIFMKQELCHLEACSWKDKQQLQEKHWRTCFLFPKSKWNCQKSPKRRDGRWRSKKSTGGSGISLLSLVIFSQLGESKWKESISVSAIIF